MFKTVSLSIAAVVVGIALIVGVFIGGRELNWWLKTDNTNRQVELRNRNTGVQTAWADEAHDLINQASLLPEGAPQRAALHRQACENIARLVDSYLDDQLVEFQAQEC